MFRGGGTAGGSKEKINFSVIKQTPKFLQQFRFQAMNQSDAVIIEKMRQVARDEEEDNENEYDVENATVVDTNGAPPDALDAQQRADGKKKRVPGSSMAEDAVKAREKVDMQSFKPTFKTKKAAEADGGTKKSSASEAKRAPEGASDDDEEEQEGRDAGKRGESSAPPPGAGGATKNKPSEDSAVDNSKRKSNLDEYIKVAMKEAPPKKKVKTNTLSFGDE